MTSLSCRAISISFCEEYELELMCPAWKTPLCSCCKQIFQLSLFPYWTFCAISRLIIHLAGERIFSGLFPHNAGLFTSEHAYFSTDVVVPGFYMIRPEWNMFMPVADMITTDWKLDKLIFIYTLLRILTNWSLLLKIHFFRFCLKWAYPNLPPRVKYLQMKKIMSHLHPKKEEVRLVSGGQREG